MAGIHELYGRLSEINAQTEEARAFLEGIVTALIDDAIDIRQIEKVPGGGFHVNEDWVAPKPEDAPVADEG